MCLCTLNEVVSASGYEVKFDLTPCLQPMRGLANILNKSKNALVIGAENEATWGIESFDYASKAILQPLHDYAVPVLSCMPLYSTMAKHKGKALAWHFNALNDNVTKMAKYINAAIELHKDFVISATRWTTTEHNEVRVLRLKNTTSRSGRRLLAAKICGR